MEYSAKSKALKKIRDLCREGKITQARKYLNEYKNTYNEDVSSVFTEAKVAFYENNLKEAGTLLEKTIELSSEDKLAYSLLNYVYYLLEIKAYKKAYKTIRLIDLKKLYKTDKGTYIRALLCKTFIEKELNIEVTNKLYMYIYDQIIEYSPNRALDSINQKHNNNLNETKTSFEMSDNELEELFYQTQEQLAYAQKDTSLDLFDHYYFKKGNLQLVGGQMPTAMYTAITLKHSNQIITMYPLDSRVVSKQVNEFKEKNEYLSSKQRVRVSQIDKFNAKFRK